MTPLFPRETFLNDMGVPKTRALFHEFKHILGDEVAIYNLKEVDFKGSLSMRNIYVECITEYEAAMKLLGSWTHWKKLCECEWFKPYKAVWDEERRMREEIHAKKILIQEAENGNVTAAKTLYEGPKALKGRPSKQEKAKAIKKEIEGSDFLTSAYNNIISIK